MLNPSPIDRATGAALFRQKHAPQPLLAAHSCDQRARQARPCAKAPQRAVSGKRASRHARATQLIQRRPRGSPGAPSAPDAAAVRTSPGCRARPAATPTATPRPGTTRPRRATSSRRRRPTPRRRRASSCARRLNQPSCMCPLRGRRATRCAHSSKKEAQAGPSSGPKMKNKT